MSWVAMGSGEPELGQLVLIKFFAERSHIRVCHFDNIESWEARTGNELDFKPAKDFIGGWFTEDDDADNWWERKYVSHWMPIPPLPDPDRSAERE